MTESTSLICPVHEPMDVKFSPRVLLIAESANPEWVSVPLEGWSHSQAIGRQVRSHLVTHVRNAAAIERAGLCSDLFTSIDSELVARTAGKVGAFLRGGAGKGWTTVMAFESLGYYYFESLVWKQFGSAIRAGKFDLVHRITPLSPTIPSLLAGKCRKAGVPFVLGPLNGGVPWPKAFNSIRRKEREWLSFVRGAHKLLPGYHGTRENAAAIIVGSGDTWNQMPPRYHDKCVYIPENAIEPSRFNRWRTRTTKRPIQVVFVGRLVPYKGADMLLEAAAPLVRSGELQLKIIGDGPQMAQLREMIAREQLSGGVELTGWVDHANVQDHLANSDLFAFPSIREFGGAVVLEAMALGVVPMVLRYGGPGELVTDQTGFLIEMADRAQIVASFRNVLERVVVNPALIDVRSAPARLRVMQQFTWDVKTRQILEVYKWVLGRRPDKPDWGMPLQDPETLHRYQALHASPVPGETAESVC